MALRACILRSLEQAGRGGGMGRATPMRALCTQIQGEKSGISEIDNQASGDSKPAGDSPPEDGRPPELVLAGAMFHSSTDWIFRAVVESFCSLVAGKKFMDRLALRYLRKNGLRSAIMGPKKELPLTLVKESRVGKVPIPIPQGVTISVNGQDVEVKGPLGALSWKFRDEVGFLIEGDTIHVKRVIDSKKSRAMHGLSRTLLSNMVTGVSTGFEKKLVMVGVGYRASVDGGKLLLNIGYKEPHVMKIPEDLKARVEENTKIILSGCNNVLLGNFASLVRSLRKPEPYKGKGIRYSDEVVRRKESTKKKKKS